MEDKEYVTEPSEDCQSLNECGVPGREMGERCSSSPPQLGVKLKQAKDIQILPKHWHDVDHRPIDILLVTAEECEFLSCLPFLEQLFKSYIHGIGFVYFGCMGGASGQEKLKVALMMSSKGSETLRGSLTVAQSAIRVLQPKAVVSVGICTSLVSEKVRMGDVVIPSKLISAEGLCTPVSPCFGDLARDAPYGWVAPLKNQGELEVKVHCDCDILSQSLTEKCQYDDILKHYPGAVASETEGKGVYSAAYDANIEWVIVKGVASYFYQGQSSATATSEWMSFASTMAASVVAKMLNDPTVFQKWPHYSQGVEKASLGQGSLLLRSGHDLESAIGAQEDQERTHIEHGEINENQNRTKVELGEVEENQKRTKVELEEVEGRQGVCCTTAQDQHSLEKYGGRLVKLLICTISLNEKQREEVERSLTVAVQKYLEFNCNPSIEAFTEHLIRVYQLSLVTVGSGSIIFTVECPTLDSLELLWSDYLSGELDKVAERCFGTEDMKRTLNLDRIGLKTIIDEQDYLNCQKALRELPSTCLAGNDGDDRVCTSNRREDYQKAIEYHEHLKIAKEISNRARKGQANGNLGNAYQSPGDYQKAIEYQQKSLKVAIEISDQAGEGIAYGNLGNTYHSLGDYQKAMEYQEKHLKIAKEIGDRAGEGRAYGNLGNAYQALGDYQEAIRYHKKDLKIAKEIGDRNGEGQAYGNLGNAYQALGDYQEAIRYHKKDLKIAKEIGDRNGEGRAYGNLGNSFYLLGDYHKAIRYHEKHLKIAKEIGDRAGEGQANRNLGNAYDSLGDYEKAIEYLEKGLKIAIEIGNQPEEGLACGCLGIAYLSLGDFKEAIKYNEKRLKIAKEIGDRAEEGAANGTLGNSLYLRGHFREAIDCHKKHLEIANEIGERHGVGKAYHNIGVGYFALKEFQNAVDKFNSAVGAFNSLRSFLRSKDNWKISFREQNERTYLMLWRSLLKIGKIDDALFAAEQGRAQTLSDKLLIQYNLHSSLSAATIDTKETISRLLRELSTPIIFLGIEGPTINIWFLRRGKKIVFRQGRLECDGEDQDAIRVLLETALAIIGAKVRCEDRTFGKLENEYPSVREVRGEEVRNPPLSPSDNPFKPFYDAVIDPIADMLGPQDDELVIVPDGVLCLTPWAAVIQSIRIRTAPSLTGYQLISSLPEGHHKKTGALLVGNPCTKELRKPLPALPCAQKEVEMIASILNTRSLTRRRATKAEVMKRMSSVGLIHIAAHGNPVTGEIALSPNPGWTSKFPRKKDYILKMSDVLATNIRARLVVLSCCHTGRGRILKGEGVIGIARAFLAAGARSVLVSLWALDDWAAMIFMKRFYQHLKEGKTASVAVHQSMKYFRESRGFSKMKYWAPFQIIGDDVKIEFVEDDHK
ncbi:tetratricopeptide repeat protein 28-like isoform X3 [Acropora muricata]|uniref:tetratricopeptide repeat protein 28-like isoform X3 n=1 Tax=Acropora muricata TaxID=159855 RepID=UPI0034E4656C